MQWLPICLRLHSRTHLVHKCRSESKIKIFEIHIQRKENEKSQSQIKFRSLNRNLTSSVWSVTYNQEIHLLFLTIQHIFVAAKLIRTRNRFILVFGFSNFYLRLTIYRCIVAETKKKHALIQNPKNSLHNLQTQCIC